MHAFDGMLQMLCQQVLILSGFEIDSGQQILMSNQQFQCADQPSSKLTMSRNYQSNHESLHSPRIYGSLTSCPVIIYIIYYIF